VAGAREQITGQWFNRVWSYFVWTYRGQPIPLEVYHGVPEGWHAAEILAVHRRLGGYFNLEGPEASEPGAPSWLPDRYEWLQYRQALYRVGDGIRANDPACIELAVQYIELRYIGSYSGFIRARLARALKRASLSEDHRSRLNSHFRGLVLRRDWCGEFTEYFRLWRRIIRVEELTQLLDEIRWQPEGEKRAEWISKKLA
jgi:hypothetical protein